MNKFIRIGYAIYNIERSTQRNNHGLRIDLKNNVEYVYYTTKKERDSAFEKISNQLIN